MTEERTPAKVRLADGLGLADEVQPLLARLRNAGRRGDDDADEAADEIERLKRRCSEAAERASTYAECHEMAVARLVLALDYMRPEQKCALDAAWIKKRAKLRALKA